MQTERVSSSRSPSRFREGVGGLLDRLRSVRTRITAAVVLLSGLALAGAGLTAYLVESARIDRGIERAVSQELEEFRTFQRDGLDPNTGKPFTAVVPLLRTVVKRNVPDPHEALVTYWDGRHHATVGDTEYSAGDGRTYDLIGDPAFLATVRDALSEGGIRSIDTPVGSVLVAVQPVTDARTSGAFVVVTFRGQIRDEFDDVMFTYAFTASGALLVVTAGAWLLAGRLLRPVRTLRSVAQEISDTDLTRRIRATGNDDLTQLTRTFNAMLDRLEDAFSAQRQFLDDAGHELRTPITIIRGHLELTDSSDASDVESTRALVMDEIDRMSRLIDDLIVLAKARRPGFVVLRDVDVGELTDEIAEKAKGLGVRRWCVDSRAEGEAALDPQRITQAMLQLVSNAARHTSEDDVIAIGSSVTADTVRLWVRDTGTGIPEEDHALIFERFQRGSAAVGDDGSGLGLSIVRAIAAGHSGTVAVSSTPGQGATFTLTLPRKGPT